MKTNPLIVYPDFLKQFHKANSWAFKACFEYYYDEIAYYAAKITENETVAEEIAADSFVKLFSKPKQFESIDKIEAFLHVITKNACLTYLQKEKVVSKKNNLFQYLVSQISSSPDLDNSQILDHLSKEVQDLPGLTQKVIKTRYFDGLSIKETAQTIGIQENTVKTQTYEGIQRLRSKIFPKWKKEIFS